MEQGWIGRRVRAAALVAAGGAAFVACAPADRAAGPRAELADGAAGEARIITIAHVMRSGSPVAGVAYADTSSAPVYVTDGSAILQDVGAALQPPHPMTSSDFTLYGASKSVARAAEAGPAALVVAQDGRAATRQGEWTRRVRLPDGRAATVEFEARGGAPVSRVTVRVDGELVFGVTSDWRRDGAVWSLAGRTVTAYRGGAATGWVETTIEAPALRTVAASGAPRISAGKLLARAVHAAADALAPAPLLAQSGSDAVGSGPCAGQEEAALDAMSDFVGAGLLFAVSTLTANPVAIVGAYVNFARVAYKVDTTQARLDNCVATA